jgi:Icc-related predicted phosphoesterase
MTRCFFVSDLHGNATRYQKLFAAIEAETPAAVFLGGDLVTGHGHLAPSHSEASDFIGGVIEAGLLRLRQTLADRYPALFLILGNDDARADEPRFEAMAAQGLCHYVHERTQAFGHHRVYGYAYVPPTPFQNKDWERYDVSAYVDPGCVSPEDGFRTVAVDPRTVRFTTIQADLERFAAGEALDDAIFLFHSPPYRTNLDRAAVDGRAIDHVPFDVNVGSVAIRRFIESRQPLLTLHGHVHESARLTGAWSDRIGRTLIFSAAHDGPELALVRFDLDDLAAATRELM